MGEPTEPATNPTPARPTTVESARRRGWIVAAVVAVGSLGWMGSGGAARPSPAFASIEVPPWSVAAAPAKVHTPARAAVRGDDEHCRDVIEVFERAKWIKHAVAPREMLHQIAHRYGVELAELRDWNGLSEETESVKARTRLRIKANRRSPPRERIEYTVAPGDTWWRVAVAHGVDRRDLRAYNWPYQAKMTPGAVLKIWADPTVRGWIARDPPRFDGPEPGIRRGGIAIGAPDDGRLLNPVEVPERPGWDVRFPDSSYGTSFAVERLVAGLQAFTETTTWDGTVRLGSMSSAVGGRIGQHKSHQSGRDIDIRLPRRTGVPRGVPLTARRIDWLATWQLLVALVEHDAVVIFLDYPQQKRVYGAAKAAGVGDEALEILQYPRGQFSKHGVVRHFPGHDTHMHVRYGCGPCEVECSRSRTGADADAEP